MWFLGNTEGLPLLCVLLEVAREQWCPTNMGCRTLFSIAKLEAFSLEIHFASLGGQKEGGKFSYILNVGDVVHKFG